MHIMDGFLPMEWCIFWTLVSIPFFVASFKRVRKVSKNVNGLTYIALTIAYLFVLSSIKFPSVAGSSSHLTGIGIGTLILGPSVMTLATAITLLFQATLLAHGGFSTLTANVVSMGIVGPFSVYLIYRALKNVNRDLAIFVSVAIGNLLVYVMTAIQLGLVYEGFLEFLYIFGVIQIPLAIFEGLVTMVFIKYLAKVRNSLVLGEV